MKTLSLSGKEVLMCEVPQGAKDLYIDWNLSETRQFVAYKFKDDLLANEYEVKELPEGDWHLLGLASEISSTTWASIVEQDYYEGIGYQYANYELERKWTFGKRFNSPTESGLSLLKAHGYKAETTILLIKK